MGAVGLIYVGAVLFVNGLMLLGWVGPRAAAPLNLFVGGLQVLTPTVLIVQAGPTPESLVAASGLYLFGFTYLWVGVNNLAGLPGEGLGWFSLFVACCALGYAWHALAREDDPAFAVIWVMWAVLWALFWVLLGLGRAGIGPAVGLVAAVEGVATAAVPGFLMVTGLWSPSWSTAAVLALIAVALFVLAAPLGHKLAKPIPSDQVPRSVATTS